MRLGLSRLGIIHVHRKMAFLFAVIELTIFFSWLVCLFLFILIKSKLLVFSYSLNGCLIQSVERLVCLVDHLFAYLRFTVMNRDTEGLIRSFKVAPAYFFLLNKIANL